MPSPNPYPVEIYLSPAAQEAQFELTLTDLERSEKEGGLADLSLAHPLPKIGLTGSEFRDGFQNGAAGYGVPEGLAFGRYLLGCLLAEPRVQALWQRIHERSSGAQRPLRIELVLPRRTVQAVADIPFELLADEGDFLLRRRGYTMVRVIQGLPVKHLTLKGPLAVRVVWANPAPLDPSGEAIPEVIFRAHEEALSGTGLIFEEPLRQVTRDMLDKLPRHAGAGSCRMFWLVAHGSPGGGSIVLQDGTSLAARDLAYILHGFAVGFLWSCFGARREPWLGSMVEALLDPSLGDLAAVVAAHGAIRADWTPAVARRLIEALGRHGELELAIAEARHALAESELQWAVPVCYMRHRGDSRGDGPGSPPVASRWRGLRWLLGTCLVVLSIGAIALGSFPRGHVDPSPASDLRHVVDSMSGLGPANQPRVHFLEKERGRACYRLDLDRAPHPNDAVAYGLGRGLWIPRGQPAHEQGMLCTPDPPPAEGAVIDLQALDGDALKRYAEKMPLALIREAVSRLGTPAGWRLLAERYYVEARRMAERKNCGALSRARDLLKEAQQLAPSPSIERERMYNENELKALGCP